MNRVLLTFSLHNSIFIAIYTKFLTGPNQDTFHLSENQAQSAYTTASVLLKDEVNLQYTVKGIIRGTKEQFTKDQIEFLLNIIARVSQFEGKPNEYQLDYFDVLSKELKPVAQVKW